MQANGLSTVPSYTSDRFTLLGVVKEREEENVELAGGGEGDGEGVRGCFHFYRLTLIMHKAPATPSRV